MHRKLLCLRVYSSRDCSGLGDHQDLPKKLQHVPEGGWRPQSPVSAWGGAARGSAAPRAWGRVSAAAKGWVTALRPRGRGGRPHGRRVAGGCRRGRSSQSAGPEVREPTARLGRPASGRLVASLSPSPLGASGLPAASFQTRFPSRLSCTRKYRKRCGGKWAEDAPCLPAAPFLLLAARPAALTPERVFPQRRWPPCTTATTCCPTAPTAWRRPRRGPTWPPTTAACPPAWPCPAPPPLHLPGPRRPRPRPPRTRAVG